jgi:hypothetical protein
MTNKSNDELTAAYLKGRADEKDRLKKLIPSESEIQDIMFKYFQDSVNPKHIVSLAKAIRTELDKIFEGETK